VPTPLFGRTTMTRNWRTTISSARIADLRRQYFQTDIIWSELQIQISLTLSSTDSAKRTRFREPNRKSTTGHPDQCRQRGEQQASELK
jgi:hypothetical protein